MFLLPLALVTVATAQKSANTSSTDVPTAIIYDNGPLATGPTARNGTAAPAGSQWSEASFNFGSTTEANTLAGVGCQVIGAATANRCADDFNVPVGQTWTINQVIVFAYQTGAVANPVIGANLRIWNGRPGDAGSVIVFGDTTTNRLGSSTDSGLFRIFNSGPPTNTATGTTRRIWQVNINVAPAAVLGAGNYWVDFQVDAGANGNFSPPTTITGVRGVPGWNARQFIGPPTNTGWADSFDDGTPVTAANIIQDFPFKLDGSIAGAPPVPASRTVDFNGDNKSDLAVARAATAGSQTTWYIQNSGGASTATQWGLGVGFAGGDVAVPEDFDGDGKADIAVWRSDPTAANFYILLSSNSTLRTEQFGKAGDDPTVSRDYDGDGKSDVAVFRSASGGGDPCGGASVWYWRPSGTPATNFAYACWGAAGDKPYPGDFDGDRKADFSVVRNNNGAGLILQDLTTAPDRTVSHGNFSDRYVCGDFDADGRGDLAAVRVNGATLTWYIIKSGGNQAFTFDLGASATDYLVPGDYDGDNKTDFGVWSSGAGANSGNFYIVKTFTSPINQKFGQSSATDVLPKPDYPVATYRVYVPEQVSR
jgi:hypothetical protein